MNPMKEIFFIASLVLGLTSLVAAGVYVRRALFLRRSRLGGSFSFAEFMFKTKPFLKASGNQLFGEGIIVAVLGIFLLWIALGAYRNL